MKIHIVTSTSEPWHEVWARAFDLSGKLEDCQFLTEPEHLNEKEQKQWADRIIEDTAENVVIATFCEITILRLIRKCKAENLLYYNVLEDDVQIIKFHEKVPYDNEFESRVMGGFFEGRGHELFPDNDEKTS